MVWSKLTRITRAGGEMKSANFFKVDGFAPALLNNKALHQFGICIGNGDHVNSRVQRKAK